MEYETQWSSGLPNGQMGKKTSIGLYYSWNGGSLGCSGVHYRIHAPRYKVFCTSRARHDSEKGKKPKSKSERERPAPEDRGQGGLGNVTEDWLGVFEHRGAGAWFLQQSG
jgi:hypothetical protein